MAIDGIGKPPISGTPNSVGSPDVTGASSRTEFTIKPTMGSEGASGATRVDNSLVDRLQSGELTRDQYLDIRADQAVHHLVGQLPTDQIDTIRATLREQLSTDPLLVTLVGRATAALGQR
jgi:hypothetical protein